MLINYYVIRHLILIKKICDGYRRGLASRVYKFPDKKNSGSGIKNENISSKKLAEELHKPVTRKF